MKNLKLIFITLLTIASITIAIGQTDEFNSTEIEIVTDNGNLKGTLLGAKDLHQPIVLIIAGSGPTDRDGNNTMMKNNSLKMLAEALYHVEISSFRYDKRGIGESQQAAIPEEEMNFQLLVADALACWKQLKILGYKNIYVAGHSQGSLIGMLLCQKVNAAGFISIAGAGEPFDKIIEQQIATQPDQIKIAVNEVMTELKQGNLVEDVNPMLLNLFRPSVQPFIISYMQLNPSIEIQKLTIPILVIQGNTDIQVDVKHANMLAKNNEKANLIIVAKMNHVLKNAPMERNENIKTYNQPDMPINDEFKNTVIKFIKAQ